MIQENPTKKNYLHYLLRYLPSFKPFLGLSFGKHGVDILLGICIAEYATQII